MQSLSITGFDTEEAEEWLEDLQESPGFSLLHNAIEVAIIMGQSQDGLATAECYNALIAIELLTALHNHASSTLPESFALWVTTNQHLRLPRHIEQRAQHALKQIRQDSELQQQWQKHAQHEQWLSQLNDLEQRLARCLASID